MGQGWLGLGVVVFVCGDGGCCCSCSSCDINFECPPRHRRKRDKKEERDNKKKTEKTISEIIQ